MSARGSDRTLSASREAVLPRRDPAWAASLWAGGRSSRSVVFCVQMMYFTHLGILLNHFMLCTVPLHACLYISATENFQKLKKTL